MDNLNPDNLKTNILTIDNLKTNNGKLSTNIWGNHFWMTMYSVALSFPNHPSDETRKHTLDFFTSLQYLLPCDNCKSHYQKLFQEFPINLNSSKDLSDWVNFIHNKINQSLNKSPVQLTYINQYLQGNFNQSKNSINPNPNPITSSMNSNLINSNLINPNPINPNPNLKSNPKSNPNTKTKPQTKPQTKINNFVARAQAIRNCKCKK